MPTYPTLLSATIDDVDNGDETYSEGDVIVLQFDMPTNRPSGAGGGGATNATSSGNEQVDALFAFSDSLGAAYSGEWVQADRFVVTVVDADGGNLVLGATKVTVVSNEIRNAAGDALTANNQSVVVDGDFGTLDEPRIAALTVVVSASRWRFRSPAAPP